MGDKAILVDVTRCTACRGCQVACKQANNLPAENTIFFGGPGYQNPADLSWTTYTVVKFLTGGSIGDDVAGSAHGGNGTWNFLKFQCMHCDEPKCVSACPSPYGNAPYVDPGTGFVGITPSKCIDCHDCNTYPIGCPFNVPRFKSVWPGTNKPMRKCIACLPRIALNGPPACVRTCPTRALEYGDHSAIVTEAGNRVTQATGSGRYPNAQIYGSGTGGAKPYKIGGTTPAKLHVVCVLAENPSFYGLPDSI